MMFFTGFADEAGAELDLQIAATRKLGWKFIETRQIGTKNLATLTEEEFESVCGKIEEAGIRFNCFGSSVANWAKDPRSAEDFSSSEKELTDAIPRMKKLGIKMIRGMSFKMIGDADPDSPEIEKIVFDKVGQLVKICEDNGILYGHENCVNYGGLSYLHTLKLLDAVRSPALTLIFDTGNPTFNYRHIGSAPYPLQSAWEFYSQVKSFVSYIHIKDAVALPREDGERPFPRFCWAGEGCGDVRAIVCDLIRSGYDGGFSIEPHIASVYHEARKEAEGADLAQAKFDSYVEYGKRFEKLYQECENSVRTKTPRFTVSALEQA